jgi:MOSC domain-containing protein YiiM
MTHRDHIHEVLKLWIRAVPRGEMIERDSLLLEKDLGVVGDYCHGRKRHVTIVFQDDWRQAERQLGRPVDPAKRRANILVGGGAGLDYCGRTVRIGECLIEIQGETRPCARMEDAAGGLMTALQPDGRAGIWGRVLRGGAIRLGDVLAAAPAAAGPATSSVAELPRPPAQS